MKFYHFLLIAAIAVFVVSCGASDEEMMSNRGEINHLGVTTPMPTAAIVNYYDWDRGIFMNQLFVRLFSEGFDFTAEDCQLLQGDGVSFGINVAGNTPEQISGTYRFVEDSDSLFTSFQIFMVYDERRDTACNLIPGDPYLAQEGSATILFDGNNLDLEFSFKDFLGNEATGFYEGEVTLR